MNDASPQDLPLRSVHTTNFAGSLHQLGISLVSKTNGLGGGWLAVGDRGSLPNLGIVECPGCPRQS
jgi:hypothetical protein